MDYQIWQYLDLLSIITERFQIGTFLTPIKSRLSDLQAAMKKALIIEDHPDMLDVLSRQLELLKFTVISVDNGMEGVEKAIAEKPDLILMDIMMPEMDGREATRIIRSNPGTKDIPILAITVLFREKELKKCIEAGCNDYLVKPFTFEELQEKIKEHLS